MKRFMIIATAALISSDAFAQVELAAEQRTKIKQYVTTQKVAPATLGEKVTVGAPLPADVLLRAVPAEWGPGVSKDRYIYSITTCISWSRAPVRLSQLPSGELSSRRRIIRRAAQRSAPFAPSGCCRE